MSCTEGFCVISVTLNSCNEKKNVKRIIINFKTFDNLTIRTGCESQDWTEAKVGVPYQRIASQGQRDQ